MACCLPEQMVSTSSFGGGSHFFRPYISIAIELIGTSTIT
jgi:hypothetical protein